MQQRTGSSVLGVVVSVVVSGCLLNTGGLYGGGAGARVVLPSRGYTRPGWTPKQVFEARTECFDRAEADPHYKALLAEARKVPIEEEKRTKEEEVIFNRPGQYTRQIVDPCIKSKGLKYGKLKPEDVYIPPPPPGGDGSNRV